MLVLSILFALISFAGWGVGDIFGTIVTRKIGAYSTTFWNLVAGFILLSLYAPFAPGNLKELTPALLSLIVALGIIGILGSTAFNEGLRTASAPLVGTIASSFGAISAVLSMLFLGERVNTAQAISIAVVLLGIIFSTLDLKELKKGKVFESRGILLAIITMLCWGIFFAFIKIPVSKIGWFWPSYITYFLFPAFFLFVRLRKTKLAKPNFKGALLPLLIGTVLLRAAELSYNIGISKGLTSVVAPIASSYPSLFVVLAFLVFRDPIRRQQIFGIVTTITGIVLLSVFSV